MCVGGWGEILPAAWARGPRSVRMGVTGGPLCPQRGAVADGTSLCWGMWGEEPVLPSLSALWGCFSPPGCSEPKHGGTGSIALL